MNTCISQNYGYVLLQESCPNVWRRALESFDTTTVEAKMSINDTESEYVSDGIYMVTPTSTSSTLQMLFRLLEKKNSIRYFSPFIRRVLGLLQTFMEMFCTMFELSWVMINGKSIHIEAYFTLMADIDGRFDRVSFPYFTPVAFSSLVKVFFQQYLRRILSLLLLWLRQSWQSLFLYFDV